MALPSTVHWSMLSPRSMEIAKVIGLRASAGLDSAEIAASIECHRDELKHLDPPPGGRQISANWVNARMKEPRTEIAATGAAEY